ncbi:MAG: DUF362 domain-containing protein [Patescibacteria group bacterium]
MSGFIVSVRACPSYEPHEVERALAAIFGDLGGIGNFAKPGRTVLVKPNLLAGDPPERAVTTHPEVVRAMTAALRGAGAAVLVGDSPGIGSCRGVAEKTGVGQAARAAGGEVAPFDRVTFISGSRRRFEVAVEVARADLVVNLPKLKTHGMMTISGAVKNLLGCMVGLRKPGCHLECQGTRDFAALLLDLSEAVASGLTVMDGILAMDGPGPRHGRARHAGLLLGATDPLALDFVLADITGIPAADVPHLRLAIERGLPQADPANRRIAGDAALRIEDFQPPPRLRSSDFSVPGFLLGFARNNLTARPAVRKTCTDCGICRTVCPAGAVTGGRGRAGIDLGKCIRCYCCEEMCPRGAIELRRGLLGRLWPWG